MAWPADDNPAVGELLIDGTWTDITERIRGNGQLRINRGRRDIQGSALMPPTTVDFILNNGGEVEANRGRFTDDNPLSPYYGLLPLYTQFRWRVPGSADNYLYMPGHDGENYARTSDKAALDITGDIDVRIDIAPASWNMPHISSLDQTLNILASKTGTTSTNCSWVWMLGSLGNMNFLWSEDGNAVGANSFNTASITIPTPTDRMAFRVTLDVNNGAGGWTVRFYSSDTIDGSWTLMNSTTFSASGTTSIFSGTGLLEIGAGNTGTGAFTNAKTFSGKIYAFQLRDGIDGTMVANADFRTQDLEDTSFSDGLGNTWSVINDALITSDSIRFWGEMEEFPDEWDSTGKDMLCRVHGADLLSRLGTPQQPLHSPIYTHLTGQYGENYSYWPFEDGSDATHASAASTLTNPATVIDLNFKAIDDLNGSDGAAQLGSASTLVRGRARHTVPSSVAGAMMYFKFGTAPGSNFQIISFTTGGSNAYWWRIVTDGASMTLTSFDADGSTLSNQFTLIGDVDLTQWLALAVNLTQDGANIDYTLQWHQVGSTVINFFTGTLAGTVGCFSGFTINGSSVNSDMYFAHVFLNNEDISLVPSDLVGASNGHIGELFTARFRRICGQIGVTPDVDGWIFDSQAVGRQPIDTALNILKDGADVDGGLLTGSRRAGNTLTYITRARIQSSPQVATLNHDTDSHLAATPKPVGGVVGVRNDVTVRRANGGSARVVVTDGRYGTEAIGVVPSDETYNVFSDNDLSSIAGWLAALGTSGERRFPEISVALNRPQTLAGSTIGKQILAADLGRWFEIDNMPAGQSPGPHEQIVQGYTEIHDNKTWGIVFNGTPYGPWRAGILENGTEVLRFAATNTVVDADVTSSATTIDFKTPDTSARWITSTEMASAFPMDVMMGGEWVTVTALTGTTASGGFYTQAATCTRSVNGVVKAQTADTEIQLRRILRFGR